MTALVSTLHARFSQVRLETDETFTMFVDCEEHFCGDHRLPEHHECANMEVFKQKVSIIINPVISLPSRPAARPSSEALAQCRKQD